MNLAKDGLDDYTIQSRGFEIRHNGIPELFTRDLRPTLKNWCRSSQKLPEERKQDLLNMGLRPEDIDAFERYLMMHPLSANQDDLQEVISGLSPKSGDYLHEARGILDNAEVRPLQFGVGDHAYEVQFPGLCYINPHTCQPILTMSYNDITLHLFELGMLSQSYHLARFLVCKQVTNEESSIY